MNYITLINTIKNEISYNAFNVLHNEFIENFNNEYRALRVSKSTAEKAADKYISGALYKDLVAAGAYSEGTTVLMLPGNRPNAENEKIKSVDLASQVKEMFNSKAPTDCYFWDSIALFKALKKQAAGRYLLKLDGHLYDAEKVKTMLECISDDKEKYIRADICQNNGALFIQQKYAAMILPVSGNDCPPDLNINSQDFLKLCDAIEKEYYKAG